MNLVALVLRAYSFVFHLTLGIFLVATVAVTARTHQSMNLDILPFDDEHIRRNVLLLGIGAIVFTLLALSRHFKFVFVLWSAIVLYLMIKWFLFGTMDYYEPHQVRGAYWLTFGALGAFFGAAWSMKTRRGLPVF